MRDIVVKNIRDRFNSINDIAKAAKSNLLALHLDVPKNKSIGEHMWCIVGARESYVKALLAGHWVGFNCSLEATDNLTEIQQKLKSSQAEFETALLEENDWTVEREELLLSLLEHEATHEGQLIRHLLALGECIPESVKWA